MTEARIKKEGVRTELLMIILKALRMLLKQDPSIHGIILIISFRNEPDFSRFGKAKINYPYQTN
jgi:hypothetical protein